MWYPDDENSSSYTLWDVLDEFMRDRDFVVLQGSRLVRREAQGVDGIEFDTISIDLEDGTESMLYADDDGETGLYLPQEYTERAGIPTRLPLDKEIVRKKAEKL